MYAYIYIMHNLCIIQKRMHVNIYMYIHIIGIHHFGPLLKCKRGSWVGSFARHEVSILQFLDMSARTCFVSPKTWYHYQQDCHCHCPRLNDDETINKWVVPSCNLTVMKTAPFIHIHIYIYIHQISSKKHLQKYQNYSPNRYIIIPDCII